MSKRAILLFLTLFTANTLILEPHDCRENQEHYVKKTYHKSESFFSKHKKKIFITAALITATVVSTILALKLHTRKKTPLAENTIEPDTTSSASKPVDKYKEYKESFGRLAKFGLNVEVLSEKDKDDLVDALNSSKNIDLYAEELDVNGIRHVYDNANSTKTFGNFSIIHFPCQNRKWSKDQTIIVPTSFLKSLPKTKQEFEYQRVNKLIDSHSTLFPVLDQPQKNKLVDIIVKENPAKIQYLPDKETVEENYHDIWKLKGKTVRKEEVTGYTTILTPQITKTVGWENVIEQPSVLYIIPTEYVDDKLIEPDKPVQNIALNKINKF